MRGKWFVGFNQPPPTPFLLHWDGAWYIYL
jgi:hypothetical protein